MLVCDLRGLHESGLDNFGGLCRIGMKFRAGVLETVCVCMALLLLCSEAGRVKQPPLCRPKELTALSKNLVEMSLILFEKANGKHLGTWSPGFPQLQVHQNSPVDESSLQCSLLFMAQGLRKIMEDQWSNLNPGDVSLHGMLQESITRIHMLTSCLKSVLGGECWPQPPPPTMPVHTFERKQWSHTLLKMARDYLEWLENRVPKEKGTDNKGSINVLNHLMYLEGIRHLL